MLVIKIVQIVISILLIISILLQNRESGLSGAFGGGSSNVYMTKRGADKFLFKATIVLATIFFGISIIALFLQ